MNIQDFKTQAEKQNFVQYWDKKEAARYVIYNAMAYRWDDGETADPIRENEKLFLNKDEAIKYADSLNLSIGFEAVVDKLFINESDLNDFEPDFEDFELKELLNISEVDETIYCGNTNEGEDIEGAILVKWNWEKYTGYARNFEGLRFANKGETENSINTGNLERTFRSNESVLLTAKEVDGLEGLELLDAVNEALSAGIYKWNHFNNNPTSAKIIRDLDIEIKATV